MSLKIVRVAVEQTAFKLDSLYDYYVPCELAEKVFAGCRVTVPFGDADRTIMGYVISGGFWPDEDTIEKKLDGVSRKFKASTYYSKVN